MSRVMALPVLACERCGDEMVMGVPCRRCARHRKRRRLINRHRSAEYWNKWAYLNAERQETQP
jgi:hypothetical protein